VSNIDSEGLHVRPVRLWETIMRMKSISTAFFLTCIAALISAAANAQTDVAASVYGAFSGTTTGNGTAQSPSNGAGALIELRHISNPILGLEVTYSYNRADQSYNCAGIGCPVGGLPSGPLPPVSVPANAHELTADWVPSLHIANFRPFGVLGAGVLLNVPSGGPDTQTQTKAVYIYGAGLDWGCLPHIGLRVQYRGNLYKAPDLTTLYSSTNNFTHTAEPMVGVYFRL
jgi:opacity protein-like surface antigen